GSARSKSDLHHQVFTIGPVGWARVAPQEVRVYMQLGDILVGRGLVGAADIEAALARQLTEGGRLGDNLIAMGLLTAEQLADVLNTAPAVPGNLEETGISQRSLLNLLLKFMLVEGCETLLDLAERLKLPRRAVQQLLDEAVHQKLIQAVGAAPGGLALSIRHALSENGRAAAKEALEQNLYLGLPWPRRGRSRSEHGGSTAQG